MGGRGELVPWSTLDESILAIVAFWYDVGISDEGIVTERRPNGFLSSAHVVFSYRGRDW